MRVNPKINANLSKKEKSTLINSLIQYSNSVYTCMHSSVQSMEIP